MLRRIGFEYAERVDPFDGGPHFVADTDDVTVIRSYRPLNARSWEPTRPTPAAESTLLVAALTNQPPYVRACYAPQRIAGEHLLLSREVLVQLGVSAGSTVHAVPIP